MTVNDITLGMQQVLRILFDQPQGTANSDHIAELMKIKQQEVMYYLEKLIERGFVYGHQNEWFAVTADGRAYVMENIKPNESV